MTFDGAALYPALSSAELITRGWQESPVLRDGPLQECLAFHRRNFGPFGFFLKFCSSATKKVSENPTISLRLIQISTRMVLFKKTR